MRVAEDDRDEDEGDGEEQREDVGVEDGEFGAEENDEDRDRLGLQVAIAEFSLGVTSSAGRTNRRCTSFDGDKRSTSCDFRLSCKRK